MKKLLVGLVIEGNSTSSTLLRLPGIISELGPIKASGLQVARRVSNFLKAGYATTSYSDLRASRTVLIRVPDSSIERVVAEVSRAELNWSEHSFVLCETWAPTELLQPLADKGAGIASVMPLPTTPHKIFAVEGDVLAVRQVRRTIERADARTIELRPGTKQFLFAACILCTAVPVPLLLMAQQALRDSGVAGNQLLAVIEEMSAEMLSSFRKGARMTWGGPLADSLESSQRIYWDRLSDTHPDMATTLNDLVEWSQKYMGQKISRGRGV